MIFKKSNLRVFCNELFSFIIVTVQAVLVLPTYFFFSLPYLFSLLLAFLHCFFLKKLTPNGNSLNQMPYSPPPSSWKFLSVSFSAILCYLFTLLYSSETPNAFTSSLQISYLVSHSGEFLGLVFSGTV